MIFKREAKEQFQVEDMVSNDVASAIGTCANIYAGNPYWVSEKNGIKTINFSKSICSEVARLTMLATGITVDGSERAAWLQEQVDKIYFRIREWVEFGCAFGTVIIKPNGSGFDLFTPGNFIVTGCENGKITGVVFFDRYSEKGNHFTKMEYHRFSTAEVDGVQAAPYFVSNRAYCSKSASSIGDPVPLEKTKWVGLMEDTPPILKGTGEPLDGMLFGVLKMPQANNVDIDSPLGLPIFHEAIEELKDLDVAYSRNAVEIFDSEKIVLLDDRLIQNDGTLKGGQKLPRFVRNVQGTMVDEFYKEINPSLNTETRLNGLNALLSQIGYKCGFSNGYFVFNEKSGMVTAKQVESDDRRTIQLIKDVRDKLESALDEAIYAASVIADLYGLAPVGKYEVTYDFGDITYNREEDRARWWSYVTSGKVPAWKYFVKFEGMSEEEAKAMVAEAKPKEESLFGEDG